MMEEIEKHKTDLVPQVPSAPSHLTKKLNKILESRIENDKDLLEAMKILSGFVKENSIRSRKNLRSEIEKRSLHLNEEFLATFRNVKEVFKKIKKKIFFKFYFESNLMKYPQL